MRRMRSKEIIITLTLVATAALLGIGIISPHAIHGQPTDGLPTDFQQGVPSFDGLPSTPVAEPEPPAEPALPPQAPVEPPTGFEEGQAPAGVGPSAAELPAAGNGGLLVPTPLELAVAGLAIIGAALTLAGALTMGASLAWKGR
jgi:hypothetical protein